MVRCKACYGEGEMVVCATCYNKILHQWVYLKMKDGCVEPQFDIIVERLNEMIESFNELKIKGVKFKRIDIF